MIQTIVVTELDAFPICFIGLVRETNVSFPSLSSAAYAFIQVNFNFKKFT